MKAQILEALAINSVANISFENGAKFEVKTDKARKLWWLIQGARQVEKNNLDEIVAILEKCTPKYGAASVQF